MSSLEELPKEEEEPKVEEKPEPEEKPVEDKRLIAAISNKKMVLKLGFEEFTVPREYFKAVDEAMYAAVALQDGDSKLVELQPKPTTPSSSAKAPAPAPGSPEWYGNLAPKW